MTATNGDLLYTKVLKKEKSNSLKDLSAHLKNMCPPKFFVPILHKPYLFCYKRHLIERDLTFYYLFFRNILYIYLNKVHFKQSVLFKKKAYL